MGAHVINRLNIPGGQVSLRPEVLRFALELEEELRSLEYKPGGLAFDELFSQISRAAAELTACSVIMGWDCLRLIQLCSKIGSYALLIAERARPLHPDWPENLNL